jgi:hypothetical protein
MGEDKLFNFEIYDFVFSFAGEDRELVEEISKKLDFKGYKLYYDKSYQSQHVGKDLYTDLRKIYKNNGKYVVCFISEYYTKKVWTTLEFTAIKERLMSTFFAEDFLIPILIDNAQRLDDIPSYIGFYQHETVDKTCQMLVEKISESTMEDNFLSNINDFIIYLCEQIYKKVSDKKMMVSLTQTNEILISSLIEPFSLIFSPDPDAQASCILIYKSYQNKNNLSDAFPIVIVTWQKNKDLYFSIHEFDSNVNETLEKLSFPEVVHFFCSYVERYLEGIRYE